MEAKLRDFWKRATSADLESYLAIYLDDREQHNLVRAMVIGVVVWVAAYSLKVSVRWLLDFNLAWLSNSPFVLLIFVPLVVGAVITALIVGYHATTIQYRDEDGLLHELQDVEGDGIARAIALYFSSEPSIEQALQGQEGLEVRWQLPTFNLAWRKFAATLATLGSGGSGGLSASVSLIGESLAAGLFKPNPFVASATRRVGLLRRFGAWWQARTPDGLQTAQLAGIAAAVATLFGAPFTAAFFATEIMYRRRPLVEKLLYALVAALVAYFLTDIASDGKPGLFEAPFIYVPPVSGRYYAILILMGIIIATVSINYVRLHEFTQNRLNDIFPNTIQRHVVGACILTLIALSTAATLSYFGLTDAGLVLVLGTGNLVINLALAGEITASIALVGLVAKMLATVVTIGSGGSAGLLIPSLFFGTMVAAVMADFLQY
jgi:CIC family chloride channel protein